MAQKYRTQDGDMIDHVVWRFYRGMKPGALEAVMEANPQLSFSPTVLPAGLIITFPDLPKKVTELTRFWT
jgi:phage tail protein X